MKPLSEIKRARPLLGTFVEINLYGESPLELNDLATIGFNRISQVQSILSFYDEKSDISKLNETPIGEWIEVQNETATVLRFSLELYENSNRIFNVAQNRDSPGFELMQTSESQTTARRLQPCSVNLGGIAKGFAVDEATKAILAHSPQVFGNINAGGDIRFFGNSHFNEPSEVILQIGLRDSNPIFQELKMSDRAIATSTIRPKEYFDSKKNRFSQENRTASVLARECMFADSLTKIVLLGDPSIAEKCLAQYNATAYLFESESCKRRVA